MPRRSATDDIVQGRQFCGGELADDLPSFGRQIIQSFEFGIAHLTELLVAKPVLLELLEPEILEPVLLEDVAVEAVRDHGGTKRGLAWAEDRRRPIVFRLEFLG